MTRKRLPRECPETTDCAERDAGRGARRTTCIHVAGTIWHVPRGFGRTYRHAAREDLAATRAGEPGGALQLLVDVLALVGYAATTEQVAGWDLRRRVETFVHAATEHARASDNPVPRHPRPTWLPDPWRGPWIGTGAFAGPSPTEIPHE